jgi:hypothetical protein
MPRLVYSSEKLGCGATIELDSGEICMISVARLGVLVRFYKTGRWNGLLGSFFGSVLYNVEKRLPRRQDCRRAGYQVRASPQFKVSESCLGRLRQRSLELLIRGGGSHCAQ